MPCRRLALLLLFLMGSALYSQNTAFNSYLIGHLYRGANQFQSNILLKVTDGQISETRNNPLKLPQNCIDLQDYWAVPPPQYPLSMLHPGPSYKGPAPTELFLSEQYLNALKSSALIGTETWFIHPDSPGLAGYVIRIGSSGLSEILPMLCARDFSIDGLRQLYRDLADYALSDTKPWSHQSPFSNSYFFEKLLSLTEGAPLVYSYEYRGTEHPASLKDLSDSLRILLRPWRDAAALHDTSSLTQADSLINTIDIWDLYRDIPAFLNSVQTGSPPQTSGRILIQDPVGWVQSWKELPHIPFPDLLFLNPGNYYGQGAAVSTADPGSSADFILFDGDPREPSSRIAFIIQEGELSHYLPE